MDKLKMQSRDVISDNIIYIAERFPNVITETVGEDGNVVRSIDFEKLHQELTTDIVEGNEERYQFTWPGKRDAVRLANAPIDKTLRPCREESVDFDNTKNLYIEGDNLDVLKLLQENYLGKVKMIYIDPPYNTGNDFVYADNFGKTAEEYKEESGWYDEDGYQLAERMVKNTESNGRFHTDWLNMFYSRLKVARNLLSDDGAILITLDDHEYANAKKVCDEVFGEYNFVATIIWENFYGRSNAAAISPSHNYIMLYSKAGDDWKNIRNLLERDAKSLSNYKNPDNDPKGPWRLGPIFASGERHEGLMYTITTPTGLKVSPPKGSHWRMLEADFWKRVEEGSIVFGVNGDAAPATKLYLSEVQQGVVPRSIWLHDEVGHTQEGKREVMALFPDFSAFDTPKPTRLIKQITTICTKKDDIIMDFFAGSSSTADAVIQLNSEDGGSRKFILVQIPEKTDEASEAYKAGFTNICEIGKERIRRAGKKILEGKANNNAGAGLFADQEDSPKIDVGFRVLKLDSSNMNEVYYTPEEFDVNSLFNENIKSDRTEEDLLFQVMLDLGVELSAKIEKSEVAGKTVWSVSDGYLLACFDEVVNESAIIAIAKQKPIYFVMRDSSLASDNVADNFDQIFEEYSKDTIRKIL